MNRSILLAIPTLLRNALLTNFDYTTAVTDDTNAPLKEVMENTHTIVTRPVRGLCSPSDSMRILRRSAALQQVLE